MKPIASGRSADVFDVGDGRVLRRYRNERSAAGEARLMLHLHALGYPVPIVHSAEGPDLVMEHIAGPTLFEELLHEPGQVERYGRLLGELHERLHRIPVPDWLVDVSSARPAAGLEARPVGARPVGARLVGARLERRPAADREAGAPSVRRSILHLDLHPMNVILGMTGPVVIDWTNAAAGPAAMDVALTVLVTLAADLHELDAPAAGVERLTASRGILLASFLGSCGVDPMPGLPDAIAYRLADPNLTEGERDWITAHGATCLDRFAR